MDSIIRRGIIYFPDIKSMSCDRCDPDISLYCKSNIEKLKVGNGICSIFGHPLIKKERNINLLDFVNQEGYFLSNESDRLVIGDEVWELDVYEGLDDCGHCDFEDLCDKLAVQILPCEYFDYRETKELNTVFKKKN